MAEALPHSLQVLHLDHTEERGGAELALARLLRAHPRWRATLVLPRRRRSSKVSQDAFGGFEADELQIVRTGPASSAGASRSGAVIPFLRFGFNVVAQAVAVHRLSRRTKPDVLWANSSRAAVYAALVPKRKMSRLVIHLRDRVDVESMGRFGFLAMSRLVLPRADAIVANSRSTLRSAQRYLRPDARVEVLQSSAGLERVPPGTSRAASSGGADPLRIGMVARLDPWKGQHLVVEAFAMVRAGTTRAISLHLAGAADFGHEDYLDELRTRISSSGLDDSVTLEGRVEDVNSFLDTMDICVQYSTRPEPLGQNVLQYLARGVAVLVAAEGGPLEWVTDGKNGILVQPRSAGALSNALLGLIENDDKRRALASNAVDTPGLLSDEEVAEGSARFLEEFMGLEGAET